MNEDDQHLWDLHKTSDGYVPRDPEAFDRKRAEWEERNWWAWLEGKLAFPFTVERIEDEGDAYFREDAQEEPCRLGHRMRVLGLLDEEEDYGIFVSVEEGPVTGDVPLADLEVLPKEDPNYWPVREYVLWFANREGF